MDGRASTFGRWRWKRAAPSADDGAAALERSGLFDAAFYLGCNPDVVGSGLTPLAHFCHFGWREGRRPNALFDPGWYARTHRTAPDENPLGHYLRRGEAHGLRPIRFFDPDRHRRWHGLSSTRSALAHYLASMAAVAVPAPTASFLPDDCAADKDDAHALARSGLFDASLYLVEGPDVRAARWDPLDHYRRWGWREGRRPNLYFDPAWYRARHLGDAEIEPLTHYRRIGEPAGLRPVATFDPGWYRGHYGLDPGTSPLAHFLANRRTQRVAPNGAFDLAFHLRGHEATLGPNRDPFAHFLIESLARDLDPAPGFDADAYRAGIMSGEPPLPAATGPAAWARAERAIPFVHFLDALFPDRAPTSASATLGGMVT